MTVTTLPSRRDEAYRYSDIGALTSAWPTPADRIIVAAGEVHAHQIVNVADANDVVVRNVEILLEPGAQCTMLVLNAGGRLGRIAIDVMCRDGADFTLAAVQLGSGKQTLEIVTTVRHAEPNATSRQVVRTVVAGGATGSYLGKVEVARGADGTDSAQDAKAMLLDRMSTANAVPQLEIYADDVKCAHGATVGELDKTALFYLAARGLPPAEAKKLLLQAFVAELLADDEALLTAALGRLEALV